MCPNETKGGHGMAEDNVIYIGKKPTSIAQLWKEQVTFG